MKRNEFLPFSPPDIGTEEIAAVVECLRSGWITSGPRAATFEDEFSSYVGATGALALSSGTAALHCALLTLGIGPGDAVIVPTMTFASAAHVVEHVGARPVLVDSEAGTLNVDPNAVERALDDEAVRCIAPVHLYGHPCDITRIVQMAEARGLAIVEDAAHALPASVDGVRIGSAHKNVPSLAAFSFYATKNLTTGEGGMLTGPSDLISEARAWSLHGMTRDAWRRNEAGASFAYDVTRAGFKYNMADLQAAIGLVQLRRLDLMHARRREIAARYSEALSSTEDIEVPVQHAGYSHAWHIYAVRLQLGNLTIDRARFVSELERCGIGASVHFRPVHLLSYYESRYGYTPADLPVASREYERLVSLPIHSRMTDQDVDDVIEAVSTVLGRHRR